MKANFLQAEHIGNYNFFLVDCQLCFDKGGRFRRVAAPLFLRRYEKTEVNEKGGSVRSDRTRDNFCHERAFSFAFVRFAGDALWPSLKYELD